MLRTRRSSQRSVSSFSNMPRPISLCFRLPLNLFRNLRPHTWHPTSPFGTLHTDIEPRRWRASPYTCNTQPLLFPLVIQQISRQHPLHVCNSSQSWFEHPQLRHSRAQDSRPQKSHGLDVYLCFRWQAGGEGHQCAARPPCRRRKE